MKHGLMHPSLQNRRLAPQPSRRHRLPADPTQDPAPPPPVTIRDCQHCGAPIAIVTLLATPNVAQVDTPHNVR